jgi:hypothetical protein
MKLIYFMLAALLAVNVLAAVPHYGRRDMGKFEPSMGY